ncbi:MAG: hypothetical protein OEX14_11285 [Paracoccaceae bacterium]|nr:hypothetical protein [Paracoccaceae bacterium]
MIRKVFFLVDGRKIEAQSIYLATSLARFLPDGWTATAIVRSDYRGQVDPLTLEILKTCNISITELACQPEEHLPWSQPYPIGNKILAAAQMPASGSFLFLDTDMVALQPLDFSAMVDPKKIYANVSDYVCKIDAPVPEHVEYWRRYYAYLGAELPEERVRLRAARKRIYVPYYNAGFVLFHNLPAAKGGHFGKAWLEAATRFEAGCDTPFPRENIDQITLPITARKCRDGVVNIDDSFNYNIMRRNQALGGENIVHYHDVGHLYRYSRLEEVIANTVEMVGREMFVKFARAFPREIRIRKIKRFIK